MNILNKWWKLVGPNTSLPMPIAVFLFFISIFLIIVFVSPIMIYIAKFWFKLWGII